MMIQPADDAEARQWVRHLISDVDTSNQMLTDEQISVYLKMNEGNVRRAAADALDAIASSETLISKVIKSQDLATDGAKVADALRKHADRLRTQADDEDDDGFVFDIVAPSTGANRPEHTEYEQRYSQVWGL